MPVESILVTHTHLDAKVLNGGRSPKLTGKALAITLFEVYGPKKWRPLLPSVTGLGIAWVITCHDSLAMSIGAVIAYVLAKSAPRIEERYNVSTSSGIIAGASIMGLVIILFRDILKWIS